MSGLSDSAVLRLARGWRPWTGRWREAAFSFIARFGVTGINYLALAFISRRLSVADFGLASFVLSAQLTVSVFIELGLAPLLTRQAAYHLGAGAADRAFNVFKTILLVKIVLNTVVCLAALALAAPAARLFYQGDLPPYILLGGIFLAVGTSFQSYLVSVWQTLGRFGLITFALLLQYGGQLAALLLWPGPGVTLPAVVTAFGLGFGLLFGAALPFFPWRRVWRASVRAEAAAWPGYRDFWLWLALGNLALALVLPVTPLILAYFRPAVDVAHYYGAFKLVQLFWIMEQVIAFVLLPWLSRRAGGGGVAGVRPLIAPLLGGSAALALLLGLSLTLLAGPLVTLVFGAGYAAAVPILYWLLPMGAAFLLYSVGNQILVSLGRPAPGARLSLLAAGLNVTGCWLLIPPLGAAGAALAGTLTMSLQMLGIWHAIWRGVWRVRR